MYTEPVQIVLLATRGYLTLHLRSKANLKFLKGHEIRPRGEKLDNSSVRSLIIFRPVPVRFIQGYPGYPGYPPFHPVKITMIRGEICKLQLTVINYYLQVFLSRMKNAVDKQSDLLV